MKIITVSEEERFNAEKKAAQRGACPCDERATHADDGVNYFRM
ncbi:hypothetical protein NO263_06675 [Gluconacetobacter entanii]|uniref:Uncharacterized protein n=1 Tax=Gluconacetobacter entanii TaxID=108528 RepID=A0ABT3K4F8_9PROT|nr:hypothetical protein [Gluconacetobacter entanii]MCW4581127.1 hypothetical protein [Gluconacetobacter entanii]MCW4584387.1 hypothetical protein [Gluconacetobacter entanii]MCW4587801.1 hypothetical protein [Gluconacetobacter entanii]MCW4590261.1 hypothetical protein [Gluconacetobacter entanii]MCW4593860.1 hypothetical protein [Gluconacetobacter entanii]